MKIAVTGVDVKVSDVLHQQTVRRVLLALTRFGPRVRRVGVRLAEPPNPLGGVDRQCRMRAWLQDGDVRAQAIDGAFGPAVARAAALLAVRVGAALGAPAGDARRGR